MIHAPFFQNLNFSLRTFFRQVWATLFQIWKKYIITLEWDLWKNSSINMESTSWDSGNFWANSNQNTSIRVWIDACHAKKGEWENVSSWKKCGCFRWGEFLIGRLKVGSGMILRLSEAAWGYRKCSNYKITYPAEKECKWKSKQCTCWKLMVKTQFKRCWMHRR